MERNLALRVEPGETADSFVVSGRGMMHLGGCAAAAGAPLETGTQARAGAGAGTGHVLWGRGRYTAAPYLDV